MILSVLLSLASAPFDAPAVNPADDADRLVVEVNIPARTLRVSLAGDEIAHFPVAVGLPHARTPTGEYDLSHGEWNPWWYPPPGREWTRGRVSTPPGPGNPMGRAKFFFRPLYFFHGTPDPESIGTAASRGCIRMHNEDVIALGRLLHEHSGPSGDLDLDHVLAERNRTRRVRFDGPALVRIRYDVVEVRDDTLWVHPDIYNRRPAVNPEIVRVLLEGMYAAERIDTDAIAGALAGAGRGGSVEIPVAHLLWDEVMP